MESCSRTQKQSQPGTWFSSRAFKKREGACEKHLNFKKNVKESSTEDEYSMSSETSELEISREFPLPKMMILGVCFVTGNFRRIVRGNFGSCALCAHCGPMWIVLGLKRTVYLRFLSLNNLIRLYIFCIFWNTFCIFF